MIVDLDVWMVHHELDVVPRRKYGFLYHTGVDSAQPIAQAHKPQKTIITAPIPIRAATDQPQPVIHALVFAMANALSFNLRHSAR